MKYKLPILLLLLITLMGCKSNKSVLDSDSFENAPVFVNIVLHYEESFQQTKSYFFQQRNKLIALSRFLRDEGITLNLQPDWAFMAAVNSFEDVQMRIETNGMNILRYIKEDLNHEIDPHAHEHGYNYADVAAMIDQLGVTPSHIVGGLIVDPPEDSKYDYLLNPIEASKFDYTWQAEWLWGDATASHVNDTPASGIWRPKDKYHFYEHDDNGPLPCIGKYTNDLDGVYDLVQRLESGTLETGKMYTAAIFIGQGKVQEMHDLLKAEMGTLKGYVTTGQLQFVSLQEAGPIWEMEYGSEGYLYIQE